MAELELPNCATDRHMIVTAIAELSGLPLEADIGWIRGIIVWASDWCRCAQYIEMHQTIELEDQTGEILVLV